MYLYITVELCSHGFVEISQIILVVELLEARRHLLSEDVCLSVCLSVRPSHSRVLSKRFKMKIDHASYCTIERKLDHQSSISETVQDKNNVSYLLAVRGLHGLSNGTEIDDLE